MIKTATHSALYVSTKSEVYELESRGYAQFGALIMQITKPILVCLSYSDKEYPLKIEYLEIRRKIAYMKKLSDDAQLSSRSTVMSFRLAIW